MTTNAQQHLLACFLEALCLCGEPGAACAQHMMTRIPSCPELDVIPHTGKRNSKERTISEAHGRPRCVSHTQPEQRGSAALVFSGLGHLFFCFSVNLPLRGVSV